LQARGRRRDNCEGNEVHPELKSTPVAFVDDDKYKIGKKISGVPVVGETKDVSE